MIKQINKLLKLVGFNLVRAKRRKVPAKWQAVPLGPTGLPPYTREELENCPPNPDWKTQNEGRTHYVGDNCPGGHHDNNCCVGYPAKVQVVNPDAAFVPVDIGADNHEMTRVEQPNSDNKVSGPTS